MATLSTYLADALINHSNGEAAYTMPTVYVCVFQATAGAWTASKAITAGQTTVPTTLNGHMYACTTAGTTGTTQPTWPTTSGGTVTDGTVVWTEMTPDFQANNSTVTGTEANYTGYARAALSGLIGAAANGSASNSGTIDFPAATGGSNLAVFVGTYDASTTGNLLKFAPMSATLAISSGITPNIPVGDLVTAMS